MGFPRLFTIQIAPGPHGEGLQGSGFSTHCWFWQTKPVLQSGSRTHSGPHPVIVSGFGTRPGSHLNCKQNITHLRLITNSVSLL